MTMRVSANVQTSVLNQHFDSICEYNDGTQRKLSNFQGLSILQVNARSINSEEKFNKFLSFLVKLKSRVDVIIVGESCLAYEIVGIRNIPSFMHYPSCRITKGGGLSVYVSSSVKHKFIEKVDSSFFSITVEILGRMKANGNNADKPIKLISYYRPPENRNLTVFLRHLQSSLEDSVNKACLIAGDVNINTLNPSTPVNVNNLNRYSDLLASYDFEVVNEIVTRKSSNAILDHVVCNFHYSNSVIVDTVDVDFSDHSALFVRVPFRATPAEQVIVKKVTNFDLFRTKLAHRLSVGLGDCVDPNVVMNDFISTFKRAFSESTEFVTKRIKSNEPLCPWLNPHLLSVIKRKDNYQKKNKGSLDVPRVKRKLSDLDAEITKWQWFYKNEYHEAMFNNSMRDRKKTWKNINRILGRSKVANGEIEAISVDGSVYTKDSDKAAALNAYFTEIGKKLAQEACATGDINKYRTLNFCKDSVFLEPADEVEVFSLLSELDDDKSPGYDDISAKALKSCADVVSPVLTAIINLSITSGVYPDCLKVARVTPIYKSESKVDPANYRPVSVLPMLNKIFEKVLYKRVFAFLSKTKFLYPRQYGFRHRSGTHTATYELLDRVLSEMDKGKVVSALFLDIRKAFDCVDHALLLQKLVYAGIRGLALQLIKSYLDNRKQCVVVGTAQSGLKAIGCGVPQGSVLGPLLFLVYVNDVSKLPLKGTISLYADDSGVFCSNMTFDQNVAELSCDLNVINDFLQLNKLQLNVGKTKVMHFHKKRRTAGAPLVFNGKTIEVVEKFKYLGLIIDSKLSWRPHIQNLCKKLAALSGVLYKLKRFLPKHALMTIYFSLGHSHLNYLVGAWGNANKTDVKQLQTLQKRCLKNVCKLSQRHSTSDLFNNQCKGVLNVSSLYQLNVCKFIHDNVHGKSHNALELVVTKHRFNTKSRKPLKPSFRKTAKSRKAISSCGCLLYNSLPSEIQAAEPHRFKNLVKKWLSLNQFPGD